MFGLLGMYDLLALPKLLQNGHSGGLNVITDFYKTIHYLTPLGKSALGIIAIAFTMAGLSTADTFLIVAGHSFVSDILVGIFKKETFGQLTETESRLFANIGRMIITLMGIFVIFVFFILKFTGLLSNPLIMFFCVYSLQFALLAPILLGFTSKIKKASVAFYSLLTGLIISSIWGFGFAIAGLNGVPSFLGITIDEWVYLTPVPTIVFGYLVIKLFTPLKA